MITVILLTLSNVFMTAAWYGHLRFKSVALWQVILVSWLIALPEYVLQVPANRWGHGRFSAAQLKGIQEVISLTVFCIFTVLYLGESVRWNTVVGFALIAAGAYFVFLGRGTTPALPSPRAVETAAATGDQVSPSAATGEGADAMPSNRA